MKLIPIVDFTPLMMLQGRLTANTNGTGIDVSKFEGPAVIVANVHNVAGTTPTADIAITESATVGGTYAAISPALAITQVTTTDSIQMLGLPEVGERKLAIRAEFTIGGTSSPSYDVAVIF